MFNNVGEKIKTIAKVVVWISIAICVIYGFVLLVSVEDMALVGLLVMTVGSFISWVSGLVLYGFGELIENSTIIANKKENSPATQKTNNSPKETPIDKWLRQGLITEEEYQSKKNENK